MLSADYSKRCEQISMTSFVVVGHCPRSNSLDFGDDQDFFVFAGSSSVLYH